MNSWIQEVATPHAPESLVERLRGEPGVVLLRSGCPDFPGARYSLVTARPFLNFRSFGSRCHVTAGVNPAVDGLQTLQPPAHAASHPQFGNPWELLSCLMSRYELLEEWDFPFPLGGCFGYWGYDLKNFVEPKLPRRAINDLELPDCHVGFYDSLVVFDHHLGKVWIVSTGLSANGSRSEKRAAEQMEWWRKKIQNSEFRIQNSEFKSQNLDPRITSNLSRNEFIACVRRAQEYIRAGDIYQVNLSQRLAASGVISGWDLYKRQARVSPSPFSAFIDCGGFQIASSSPELFLRLSGGHVLTRPIKGTRPRSADPARDAQLTRELQTSAKEMAELVMITDLLRNDLGKVCEFGSVQVPELARLERYAQVQHLVSTVEGRLRPEVTHCSAFASCFPGGSITGAPKCRAMEIIDELEPVTRGPYTGALGYLGFNRESQLSIIIRAAICARHTAYFQVGAGIVADSDPAAEYEETLAKARGFFDALKTGFPVPSAQFANGAQLKKS
jgi:para-aminobenzoate synthetase component 1